MLNWWRLMWHLVDTLSICWTTHAARTLPGQLHQQLRPWALYLSTATTATPHDYEETAIVLQVLGPTIEDSSLMAMLEHLLRHPWQSTAAPMIVRLMGSLFALMAGRQDTMAVVRSHAEALLALWRQSTDDVLDRVMLVVMAATSPLLYANASALVYERSISCPTVYTAAPPTIPFRLQAKDTRTQLVHSIGAGHMPSGVTLAELKELSRSSGVLAMMLIGQLLPYAADEKEEASIYADTTFDARVARWISELAALPLTWLAHDQYRAELLRLCLDWAGYGATAVFSSALLDCLMPHYTASLSAADQHQLAYLWHYERSTKEEPMLVHALKWSPHPNSVRAATEQLLLANRTPNQVSAALSLLNDIDRERMWHTVRHFPMARPMDRVCTEADTSCYDPVYFLSVFSFLASLDGVVPARMWVETHALALAVAALSAIDDKLRRVAYILLDQLLPVLQATDDWKERRQVLWLLVALKSSIAQRDPLPARLPTLITQFAAHALKLALTPWHYMYPLVNGFLLQRPRIDLEDVPMFYSLFHAATPDAKRRKQWMLHLLVDGLREPSDYALYRRRHVIDLCLGYASSPLCDQNDFKLLLSRASDIDSALEDSTMQHGVLAWLQAALTLPVVTASPPLQLTMAGL
ncbi:hypothetical protein SYNPS1DRAFT_23219, partial [Syncephalis pseudoplumigaleata]